MHHRQLWPIKCEDTGEVIVNYTQYSRSNHWKRIKVLFKHSPFHKGRCYVCGSLKKLELHHKTYERIGREELADFQELCDLCHSLVHNLAMTGKQMGVTIGNAADAMLGDKAPGTHGYANGGQEEFRATARKDKKKKRRARRPAGWLQDGSGELFQRKKLRAKNQEPTRESTPQQSSKPERPLWQHYCRQCAKLVDASTVDGLPTCPDCGGPLQERDTVRRRT